MALPDLPHIARMTGFFKEKPVVMQLARRADLLASILRKHRV
jgi:hypothetical protein